LSYLPLVRLLADRVRRQLPFGADIEPLVHSGVVGLLEALDRFDPGRGVSFQAYARYRIHGEIVQCLRSLDSVSRSARLWRRRIASARTKLSATVCREPTSEEVAAELGLSLDSYHRVHGKLNESPPVRLDGGEGMVDEQGNACFVSAAALDDPSVVVERRDLVTKMREAVRRLPERERCVVEYHHRDGMTLREIGERLGLTEGRICQIYNKARAALHRALDESP